MSDGMVWEWNMTSMDVFQDVSKWILQYILYIHLYMIVFNGCKRISKVEIRNGTRLVDGRVFLMHFGFISYWFAQHGLCFSLCK